MKRVVESYIYQTSDRCQYSGENIDVYHGYSGTIRRFIAFLFASSKTEVAAQQHRRHRGRSLPKKVKWASRLDAIHQSVACSTVLHQIRKTCVVDTSFSVMPASQTRTSAMGAWSNCPAFISHFPHRQESVTIACKTVDEISGIRSAIFLNASNSFAPL